MGSNIYIPKGLKHSFWSVLDAAAYPVVYMATMPILMKGLGVTAFGFWIVINTIIITLQLFNLNIGLTTTREVSYSLAEGNLKDVGKLINALLQLTFFLLLIVVVIGVAMAYVIPGYNLFQLSNAPVSSVGTCLFLAALLAGLKFFDLIFGSLLKASEYFRAASIVNTINRTVLLLINLVLAVNHYSVLHLLIANIVFALIYLIVQSVVIRRHFPFYRFSFKLQQAYYRPLLKFSFYPWLQFLIVVVAFQTDRFWVASFGGLTEVSSYGLTATIFNHIHMVFIAMASWVLPRIAAMVAKGDDTSRLYYSVRGGLLSLTTLSLLVFYFVYPYVLHVWVGGEIFQTIDPYIKAFIGFEIVFAHTIMPFLYLNAAGKEKIATLATFIYSSLCYLLMISGLYFFRHPVYLVYGMTLAICITMPFVNYMVQQQIKGKEKSFFSAISEMIPLYLSIAILYVPQNWLNILLLPVVVILLYRFYLSGIIEQKLWKLQTPL
jgi:O-antigen/teichoic acid export membrane protein